MKSKNIKTYFNNISDLQMGILASILPIFLMIIWQINNSGLPYADANDFIGVAGKISNYFYNADFFNGIYALYSERPWRPVSFHLLLFPFMLLSKNNILFTAASVHIVCLFFIVLYSFFLFRKVCDCKITSFASATSVGLLSGSFFPGGMFLFAETALTPAVLGTIYHFLSSNYLKDKKQSIYALIAMSIAFTVRPIEAILHLLPVFIYFFYKGYREKIFSPNVMLLVIKFLFVSIFILSLRGLDLDIDRRIQSINEKDAGETYEILFKSLLILLLIIFLPKIINFFKNLFNFLKNSRQENNHSYVLIVFSIFSFFILIWFFDSWRDLYIWIYRTQLGDIASSETFLSLPNTFSDLWNRIYYQLMFCGLVPVLFLFVASSFAFISRIKTKDSIDKKVLYLLFYGLIIPVIPVLISISNTPRKFALSYILLIILGFSYSLMARNIRKYLFVPIIFLVTAQTLSIYSVIDSKNFKYSKIISGNFVKPMKHSYEPKIIDLIYKQSLLYNFKNVDLAYMHPKIEIDIFTSSMINGLIPKKSYITTLPVLFKEYEHEWLHKRLQTSDAIFLINPYGSMSISQIYAEKFLEDFKQTNEFQVKFYNDIMYLYFSEKLKNKYNFFISECIDLPNDDVFRQGCLLIKKSASNL